MDLDPSWNFLFQHWKEIVGFTWTHQSSLFSSHFKTMSQWYRNSIKSNWNIYCAIVVSTYSSQKKKAKPLQLSLQNFHLPSSTKPPQPRFRCSSGYEMAVTSEVFPVRFQVIGPPTSVRSRSRSRKLASMADGKRIAKTSHIKVGPGSSYKLGWNNSFVSRVK